MTPGTGIGLSFFGLFGLEYLLSGAVGRTRFYSFWPEPGGWSLVP